MFLKRMFSMKLEKYDDKKIILSSSKNLESFSLFDNQTCDSSQGDKKHSVIYLKYLEHLLRHG